MRTSAPMLRIILGLVLWLSACSRLSTPTPALSATATVAAEPLATVTLTPAAPASTSTAVPTATQDVATEPLAPAGEFHLEPDDIGLHPDPQLYSGDIVSIEVLSEGAPPEWQGATVRVYAGSRDRAPLAEGAFGRFGIGGRAQATFTWVWDTAGLRGPQTLVVTVEPPSPEGSTPPMAPTEVLTLTVNLLPAGTRRMPEPLAEWDQAQSECCIFHYLTGTAAERDIEAIAAEADAAFAHVEAVLGVERQRQVVFTLLSRLLGHGGFAADEISLTYIDRDPAASDPSNVFAHEGTHVLDRQIARSRPTIMTEGLAVYVAGGHFKPEDLHQRAAALLALGRYIPLADLANNFYPSQHEIGYLEGGALVAYLVDRFGWDPFKTFYGSFQSAPTDAEVLDSALRSNFDLSLSELEAGWLEHLRALPADPAEVDDLRLTITLYDSLRRYQQLKDPSAYFLTAWLPDASEARQRGIVADFVRHPRAPDNIALESMLSAAGDAVRAGDFARADHLLRGVNAALDSGDLRADPLAADYLEIVGHLSQSGYEAQSILVDEDMANVTAIRDWPALDGLTLARGAAGWTTVAVFDIAAVPDEHLQARHSLQPAREPARV